jgi:uncharacterized membrane protein
MVGLSLADVFVNWGSFYANHAAVRTTVSYVHVAALIAAGGAAITADRGILSALRLDGDARRTQLAAVHKTHRVVAIGLVLISISGVLLFAADVDTYLYSRVFWIKMGLMALLLVNGAVLMAAERRASRGGVDAWSTLRFTAFASLALWFLTTLGGVALPNIG